MPKLTRRHYLWILLAFVVLLFIFFSTRSINNNPNLWVSEVIVTGAPANQAATIKQAMTPYLRHNIVDIDLAALQKMLLSYAWVADVQLQRVWPHTLAVHIYPQKLLAQWNDHFAINAYGELFPLHQGVSISPALFGVEGQHLQVFALYQQLQAILAPLSVQIQQIRLDKAGNLSLKLTNGLKIQLGEEDVLTRLQRFVKVYPRVFPNDKAIAGRTVDLRYPNGMAVSRRKH